MRSKWVLKQSGNCELGLTAGDEVTCRRKGLEVFPVLGMSQVGSELKFVLKSYVGHVTSLGHNDII